MFSFVAVVILAIVGCSTPCFAQDPASSWLTYVRIGCPCVCLFLFIRLLCLPLDLFVFNLHDKKKKKKAHTSYKNLPIQSFYVETVVPDYPTITGGSAAYWQGIEDEKNLNLIQPIMPKHSFGGYDTFVEHFDWHTGSDEQSTRIRVKPGLQYF